MHPGRRVHWRDISPRKFSATAKGVAWRAGEFPAGLYSLNSAAAFDFHPTVVRRAAHKTAFLESGIRACNPRTRGQMSDKRSLSMEGLVLFSPEFHRYGQGWKGLGASVFIGVSLQVKVRRGEKFSIAIPSVAF